MKKKCIYFSEQFQNVLKYSEQKLIINEKKIYVIKLKFLR